MIYWFYWYCPEMQDMKNIPNISKIPLKKFFTSLDNTSVIRIWNFSLEHICIYKTLDFITS